MLWRLCVVVLALGTISAGALAAVALWVLFGSPLEPPRSTADARRWHFELGKGESPGGVGPIKVTGTSQQDLRREPGAQDRREGKLTDPSIAFQANSPPAQSDDSGGPSAGSSSPVATEPKKPQIEMGAGADQPQPVRIEPQDRRRAAQQEISTMLTDLHPRMQCSVDLCAARYASFHAADCTYQPHGGGQRRICELSTGSAEATPQMSRAATDSTSEAMDARVAVRAGEVAEAITPTRTGAQCNVDLCAAKYASFRAADCTYQPHGGGQRRICEQ